jgi:hypothetical protein
VILVSLLIRHSGFVIRISRAHFVPPDVGRRFVVQITEPDVNGERCALP